MEKYINTASDLITGKAIPSATVTVYRAGTGVMATLYSDNGVTTTGNPVTADEKGKYSFYAINGLYDITIAKTGYTPESLTNVSLYDVLEASDYGMYLGSPDSTGALQAAINAVQTRVGTNNSNGDIIEIAPGTHTFLGTINITNSFVRLIGKGRQSTTLNFNNGANNCIVINGASAPGGNLREVSVEDMNVNGASKTGGATIKFINSYMCKVSDVAMEAAIIGVEVTDNTNSTRLENMAIFPTLAASTHGIYWHCPGTGATRSDALSIENVLIQGGFSNADGLVWDGYCQTLVGNGLRILGTRNGMRVLNTAASGSFYPTFSNVHDLEIEGCKTRALEILGGNELKFTDFDISNLSGATSQGNADDHAIYLGSDNPGSVVRGVQLTNGRVGLCRQNGININSVDTQITNLVCASASFSGSGLHAAIRCTSTSQDVQFANIRSEEVGGVARTNYLLQLDAGANRIFGTNLDASFCTAGDILNNTTNPVGFFNVSGNGGGYSPYKGSLFANYANDAAAAAGGIVLGGWYRNGSIVQQRVV